MAIHEALKQSIPDALRAHDEVRLRTLRSLVTAMTNEVVAKKRKPDEFLTDEEALAVLKRAASQRKDSIEQFEKAGRTDLSAPEKAELMIIDSYLPRMIAREQIEAIAREKMIELGVKGKADAGKFIGALMKELKGRADRLRSLSPENVLGRGYSITTDRETGAVVRSAAATAPGRRVEVRLAAGQLAALIEETTV